MQFPEDEQVEAEVWGLKRLKDLGAFETPQDFTIEIKTKLKRLSLTKPKIHSQPDQVDLKIYYLPLTELNLLWVKISSARALQLIFYIQCLTFNKKFTSI